MVTITFQQPVMLILLAGLPFIITMHLFSTRAAKRKALLYANFEALQRVVTLQSKKGRISPLRVSGQWSLLFYRIITYSILVVGLAQPILWLSQQTGAAAYVIALDTSTSMLAKDIPPSRFSAAKAAAEAFLIQLPYGSKAALISFSGLASIEAPLTHQVGDVRAALKEVRIKELSGTDIAAAISQGVNILTAEDQLPRRLILITDGRQTQPTSLREAVQQAREAHVTIDTLGIGTERGRFITGNLLAGLDEETLKWIANQTDGTYYRIRQSSDLEGAFTSILSQAKQLTPVSLASSLLIAGIILLFLEWGLLLSVFKELP